MDENDKKEDIELSQEEFESVLEEIEEFDNSAFCFLAGSADYEIIPTTLENGKVLDKKEIAMLKREVERLGSAILYRIDHPNGETLLIKVEAKTLKIMLIKEGMQ